MTFIAGAVFGYALAMLITYLHNMPDDNPSVDEDGCDWSEVGYR